MMYAVAAPPSTISDRAAFAMTLGRRRKSAPSKRRALTAPPNRTICLKSSSEKAAADEV